MNKSFSALWAVPVAFVLAAACLAQELKPEDVLEGAAVSAKSYLRDTTELPLRVATITSEFDAAGHLRKTRRDTHCFSIVEARPDEYKARGDFSAGTWLFHHRSFLDQMDSDMTAGMLLRPDVRQNFDFKISRPGAEPLFLVRYRSLAACTFEITGRHLKLTNWCGSGEYAVEPAGYSLRHFTFEAAGSPLLEGKRLRAYRLEETFQSVTVPGTAKPFVIPKTITTTYEQDSGKTVMSSEFTLLPASHQ
jgi:hypothetical protein